MLVAREEERRRGAAVKLRRLRLASRSWTDQPSRCWDIAKPTVALESVDWKVILPENLTESKAALIYGQMNEPPGARMRVGLVSHPLSSRLMQADACKTSSS